MDIRRSQARSLLLPTLVLAVTAALSGVSPGSSSILPEGLTISVTPNPAPSTSPLVVTVTGIASCPSLQPPIFGDGTVDYVFDGHCPILPPAPSAFTLHHVLDPLAPGSWEIRVGTLEPSTEEFVVVDAITVTVVNPLFTVELTPSPATEDDEVVARVIGEAICPVLDLTEITEDRIRLDVIQILGICDPPIPFGPFDLEQPLGQLPAGDYTVEVFIEDQLAAETSLQVFPAGTCLTRETVLCVNDGRFRVEATWTTPAGESGPGMAVEETADAGFFWFFDPDNIELVVKVLDACDTEFESFWVFAGGLTDVGVTLTVTDTETEAVAAYDNPVGRRFETITDTAAFATCP